MLVKSYQFTGIYFGHLGQLVPNNMKQSGICTYLSINHLQQNRKQNIKSYQVHVKINQQMFLRILLPNFFNTIYVTFTPNSYGTFAKMKLSNTGHPLVCNFCFVFPVYQSSIYKTLVISITPKPQFRNYS